MSEYMTCNRCGKRRKAWNLVWAWVFVENAKREFMLVCTKCKKEHDAS